MTEFPCKFRRKEFRNFGQAIGQKTYFWAWEKLMKRHLPNVFTCLNLFCGCIAVTWVLKGHMITASYLIFAAAFGETSL